MEKYEGDLFNELERGRNLADTLRPSLERLNSEYGLTYALVLGNSVGYSLVEAGDLERLEILGNIVKGRAYDRLIKQRREELRDER